MVFVLVLQLLNHLTGANVRFGVFGQRNRAARAHVLFHANGPLQHVNLWNDPAHAAMKRDLLDDLWSNLPPTVTPLRPCDAPV